MALREPFPGFPPPLTTRPEGLLSMLGLQTNGSYPQHLAYDQLQPSLDLLNWYLESRAEIQGANGVAFTAGLVGDFQALFTVPQQEVWVLLNYTLFAVPVAIPTACRVQGARVRSNDNLSRIALTEEVAMSPGILPMANFLPAMRWLVLRPSVQVGFVLTNGGVVNNFMSATLRFVRCAI